MLNEDNKKMLNNYFKIRTILYLAVFAILMMYYLALVEILPNADLNQYYIAIYIGLLFSVIVEYAYRKEKLHKYIYDIEVQGDGSVLFKKNKKVYRLRKLYKVIVDEKKNKITIFGEITKKSKLNQGKTFYKMTTPIRGENSFLFLQKFNFCKKMQSAHNFDNIVLKQIMNSDARNREEWFMKEIKDAIVIVPAKLVGQEENTTIGRIDENCYLNTVIMDNKLLAYTSASEIDENVLKTYPLLFPISTRQLFEIVDRLNQNSLIFNSSVDYLCINSQSDKFNLSLDQQKAIRDYR